MKRALSYSAGYPEGILLHRKETLKSGLDFIFAPQHRVFLKFGFNDRFRMIRTTTLAMFVSVRLSATFFDGFFIFGGETDIF